MSVDFALGPARGVALIVVVVVVPPSNESRLLSASIRIQDGRN